ncbi:hypothetical protein JRO89_XS09G0223300 [Xanthoceras sorbifolium]|uniref:Uncharacterized protein n=1 Tax=Xanthoceras sorbifolium TaxID=99658 RepID=A0ABQ8HMP3_9ROSI|nr:hypothetical protein JRO89_XS09G0223300 [Xanthoceras sorbifolium]
MNAIPTLPPFNIPVWKFEVHGDYMSLKINNDIDSEESASPSSDSRAGTEEYGGDAEATTTLLFCLSPDVNTKADNFIKKFRDGLKLEKMNSVKEKEGGRIGRSNLGPAPGPSLGPKPCPS